MKLYPPMYPGDSILQPATVPGGDVESVWRTTSYRALFVRSNSAVGGAAEAGVDLIAIEEQARAARSAWVGSKLRSYYQALVQKFARGGQAEMKNYLGVSQSLAELDERIRREERMQS